MKTVVRINLIISLVLIFQSVIGQTYTIPWAQQQPAWVFPLWFEDGEGKKDTAYMCFDPEADNLGIGYDTIFGEKFIKQDTTSFFISLSCICPPYDTIAIKAITFPGLPSSQLDIWKARLPLKIKWDKTLFYDPILLSIPVPNTLPDPLFLISMFCNDNNPNYINCGVNYPIFWVPEDNIGCCPDPYGLGIKTDSMIFYGDTEGPLSIMTTSISIDFDKYVAWIGIDEFEESAYQVFPNPVNNKLFIKSPKVTRYTINLYSLYGHEIIKLESNFGNSECDLSHLDAGVYLLRLSSSSNSKYIKLIKK